MPRTSYAALRKQIDKLQAQAAKLEATAQSKKDKAAAQVMTLMKKLGVTVEDLAERQRPGRGARKAASKASGKSVGKRKYGPVAPKFKDPKTGETWSGRGRTPRWLAAHEAKGKSREEFRIQ
jgi:DNA-binding protein H-NS